MTDLDLWTQALPLAKALNEFGPKELVAALAARPQRPPADYLMPLVSLKNAEMTGALAQAAARVKHDAEAHWTARRTLEQAVFSRYRSGDLLLLGFDGPRALHSVPTRILPHHLSLLPDWENSIYRHDSLNLTELRMIETPQEMRDLASPRPSKLGRPGIGQQVRAAFAAMVAEGKINPEASALAHYPVLRRKLQEAGDHEALKRSDEGLRAHFSPLFHAFKTDRKQ